MLLTLQASILQCLSNSDLFSLQGRLFHTFFRFSSFVLSLVYDDSKKRVCLVKEAKPKKKQKNRIKSLLVIESGILRFLTYNQLVSGFFTADADKDFCV